MSMTGDRVAISRVTQINETSAGADVKKLFAGRTRRMSNTLPSSDAPFDMVNGGDRPLERVVR